MNINIKLLDTLENCFSDAREKTTIVGFFMPSPIKDAHEKILASENR